MLTVYTDITHWPGTHKACTVSLILSDTQFIGCYVDELTGDNTLALEIQGIIKGVTHAQEHSKDSKINVYCDNANAVQVLTSPNLSKRLQKYYDTYKTFINSNNNVNCHVIKGHDSEINGNVIVDRLSNWVMRLHRLKDLM